MRRIGDLVTVDSISVAREERNDHVTIDPMATKLVEYVFAKFYLLCRGMDALYADGKRLQAEKTQWQVTFTREGYTGIEHIRKALLRLEKHRYPNPPQLGEFLAWNESTPEEQGFLTKEHAFNRSGEYLRDGYLKDLSPEQNLLIHLAVKESDRFFLRNNPVSKTQPVFCRNYEIIVRNFLDGKIQDVPKGLEDKAREAGIENFSSLRGYEQCMPEIRKIVGMNEDGTAAK